MMIPQQDRPQFRRAMNVSHGNRKLVSEYILFVHTVMVFLLSRSSSLVWYLNYFSIFTAGFLYYELIIKKKWRPGKEFKWIFGPLFCIAGMSFVPVIFEPILFRWAFMILYAYILAVMYYALVSATGRIWFFTIGLFISLAFIFFSQGMEAVPWAIVSGTRGKIVLGTGESGDMLNMNLYALICLFCLIFASYQVFETVRMVRSRLYRTLIIVACVAIILVSVQQIIFVTGSRKGMVLMCFIFCVTGFIGLGGRLTAGRLFVSGMIASVLLFLGVVVLSYSPFYWRLEELFRGVFGDYTNESSYLVRIEFIKAGIDFWLDSPIYGDFCRFRKVFGTYSHSTPVDLLVNHGIIGLGLYYSYYFIFFKMFFLPCVRSKHPVIVSHAIFIGSVLLMFLLWEVGAVNYYSRYSFPVVGVLIGLSSYDLKVLERLRARRSSEPGFSQGRRLYR